LGEGKQEFSFPHFSITYSAFSASVFWKAGHYQQIGANLFKSLQSAGILLPDKKKPDSQKTVRSEERGYR